MNRTALSFAALACTAGAVIAQPSLFAFSGSVIEVDDPEGLFDPSIVEGGSATGSFSFDATSDPFSGPSSPFGQFNAISFDVSTGEAGFDANTPAAVVFDNVINGIDGDGSIIDVLIVIGELLGDDASRIGEVRVDFLGDDDWVQGLDLPDPNTFGLQNLLSATLQITIDPIITDPFGDGGPIDPDDFIFEPRAVVIIELQTIFDANGFTIATIGCVASQLAAPVALSDLSDTTTFIDAFLGNAPAADLNRDGIYDLTDVDNFIDSFLTCGR